jgi:hypothetical protein
MFDANAVAGVGSVAAHTGQATLIRPAKTMLRRALIKRILK